MNIVLLRLSTLIALFCLIPLRLLAQDAAPAYVGSAACSSCHAEASADWAKSDHAHAWMTPSETSVLGDFGDVTFDHGGQISRFFRQGADYMIETEGPDGQRRAYKVVGVAGIRPLQQYLLSPEPGRTQAYDIAWDVEGKRWYPVFADQTPPPGDGFHWTGPYKSWEARCAECHATDYSRNYDDKTRTYAPKMSEIGVGCEACHGPGSAHVAWAEKPDAAQLAKGLTALGLTVDLTSQTAEVGQCMTCHSRREAMIDGNMLPGTDYHDAYTLSLLRPGTYFADGQILDEVYEGGSFLQSKMFGKGVRCTDCHDPHTMERRAEGNAVCTQCHSPAGNPRFPSLPLRVFDGPEHTHHSEGSPGAQCVSCHMIERTYMGIDTRRDHSFRIPRPDLSAQTGAPDTCTACHTDKDPAWAAGQIAAWFPDSTHRGPHYGTTLAAAQADPTKQVQALLALAEWREGPGIVRASAIELLGQAGHAASAGRVEALLADPDPLVRAAAAGALAVLPPDQRLTVLMPVLTDPARSVREAAAKALLGARPEPGSAQAEALGAAMAEWQQALRTRTDFPETHLQIGGAALQMRNFPLALQAFQTATSLDPQLVDAWSMVIRIQAALGDQAAAQQSLQQALAANPGNPQLLALGGQ